MAKTKYNKIYHELKMKIEEICAENGIDAQVESIDFNAAQGRKADLIVTVKELAEQFV